MSLSPPECRKDSRASRNRKRTLDNILESAKWNSFSQKTTKLKGKNILFTQIKKDLKYLQLKNFKVIYLKGKLLCSWNYFNI